MHQVSCLVTCYNERPFIGAAIESVLAQSAADQIMEILVVDDGSTDGSGDLLDQLASTDTRLRIFHIDNGGISRARNYGLHQAHAPLVALLDGDDLWHRDKLARQLSVVDQADEAIALWYSDYVDFSGNPDSGSKVAVRAFSQSDTDTLERYFVGDGPILPSTVILSMPALQNAGLFDESVRLFEEMDLWLRLAAAGYRFQHVPGALTFKRQRSGSLSSDTTRWESAFEAIGDQWANRCPQLRPLVQQRRAYRLAKIAQQYFLAGKDREAWPYLWRSLTLFPGNRRSYLYGLLALFPYPVRSLMTRGAKALRAQVLIEARPRRAAQ